MKSTLQLCLIALAVACSIQTVRADHNDHNDGASAAIRLSQEANQLNNVVQYSYLRFDVKRSASYFAQVVSRLSQCESYGGGYSPFAAKAQADDAMVVDRADESVGILDHNDHNNPGYPGYGCSSLRNQVVNAWSGVEHFLCDTQYDQPNVYYQYVRTREAVEALRYSL